MRLALDADFARDFRRLAPDMQKRTHKALEKFRTNPGLPGLNFEKLRGQASIYSIRVTRRFRVLLKRETDKEGELFVAFHVGSHDIYRTV